MRLFDEKRDNRQISIDKLLGIFRGSLLQLIPKAEELKISWKEGESYDEWDEICQVLYKSFVKKPIEWEIAKDDSNILIPDYDMLYENYSDFSYIACPDESDKYDLMFHSFVSRNGMYDTVQCIKIDEHGRKINKDFICLPYEKINCIFRYKKTINTDKNGDSRAG